MIVVFFGAIKRAELAIDIADVGVIDVAIDDVSDDVISAAIVGGSIGAVVRALARKDR